MSRSIYPTAEQLVDGVVWPCHKVPRLRKAGLGGIELRIRHMEIMYPDDDEYWPDIDVYWRKMNSRKWHYMGSICYALDFRGLPSGTKELLRYLNDLEDARSYEIGEIVE